MVVTISLVPPLFPIRQRYILFLDTRSGLYLLNYLIPPEMSEDISYVVELPTPVFSKELSQSTSGVGVNIGFLESSYFSLPSRGSVYTFVPLKNEEMVSKVLIASMEKVYCLESPGNPSLVDVPLPPTPEIFYIVSMDACQQEPYDGYYMIGITYVKNDIAPPTAKNMFKVFTDWEFASEQKFQNVSECSVPLDFMPYKLCHTKISISQTETVWLLSGSDSKVHMFRLVEGQLCEEKLDSFFPEFNKINGIVLHMALKYYEKAARRTTVIGEESGKYHIYEINVQDQEKPVVEASRIMHWDSPISSGLLFNVENCQLPPNFLTSDGDQVDNGNVSTSQLLVSTSLEGCYTFSDAFMDEGVLLEESSSKDVVTCSLVCDIDFDGQNEILIGTFGQVIKIYKQLERGAWYAIGKISLPTPVISMAYEDVTGDGICSLIVMTVEGVHIYDHNQDQVMPVLMKRLQQIVASINKETLS